MAHLKTGCEFEVHLNLQVLEKQKGKSMSMNTVLCDILQIPFSNDFSCVGQPLEDKLKRKQLCEYTVLGHFTPFIIKKVISCTKEYM